MEEDAGSPFKATCAQLFFPIKNAEDASEGKISTDLVGIKALDDRALRIDLHHPMPHFLSLVSFCNFRPIPRHLELANPSLSGDAFPILPLTTSGPFQLARWEKGRKSWSIKILFTGMRTTPLFFPSASASSMMSSLPSRCSRIMNSIGFHRCCPQLPPHR